MVYSSIKGKAVAKCCVNVRAFVWRRKDNNTATSIVYHPYCGNCHFKSLLLHVHTYNIIMANTDDIATKQTSHTQPIDRHRPESLILISILITLAEFFIELLLAKQRIIFSTPLAINSSCKCVSHVQHFHSQYWRRRSTNEPNYRDINIENGTNMKKASRNTQ